MRQETAEVIALQALGWLAGQEDLLDIFMGATGAARDDLRDRADDPEFLASVLDFLTMDDKWVVGFCNDAGLGYDQPLLARQGLPGGGQIHWT